MCPERQIFSLYADNELPSPWKEKTELHLASCESCRSYYEKHLKLKKTLLNVLPPLEDEAVKKAQERVWEKFPSAMSSGYNGEALFASAKKTRKTGWKRVVSLPVPLAAAAGAIFIITALLAVKGFITPARERAYEQVTTVVPSIGNEADINGMIPVSNMAEILQYLSRQESREFVIIQIPDSRNFTRSGEPALLRKADYSRRNSRRQQQPHEK
ncbi:MAG: zf-HC2 domain-containing protein [Treponema sp.]|jgi:anti-sigma factor RsiW|nr:zf-HC2 domain-containing protein [Treponema sp.]